MKQVFLTDQDCGKIVQRRLALLQYIDDFSQGIDVSGSDFSDTGSNPFPGLGGSVTITDELGNVVPNLPSSHDEILDSYQAWTSTPNPSLSQPLSNLGLTGGAALNTVSANPTVYSSGSKGTVSEIANISSVIGQWGYSISNILGAGSGQAVGVYRTQAAPASNSRLIFLGLVVIAIIALIAYEE